MFGRLHAHGDPAVGSWHLIRPQDAGPEHPPLFSSAARRAACLFRSSRCASALCFHSFAARLLAVLCCQPCLRRLLTKIQSRVFEKGTLTQMKHPTATVRQREAGLAASKRRDHTGAEGSIPASHVASPK